MKNIETLTDRRWMPSRIPIRDALTTFVPKDVKFSEKDIPSSYEQRWFPQEDGGLRLIVPYDGGSFNDKIFSVAKGAWDHTTCDICNKRIPSMTLCFVTVDNPYMSFCWQCYSERVIRPQGIFKFLIWHGWRLLEINK